MANEIQLTFTTGQTTYALLYDGAGNVWHPAALAFVPYLAANYTSYPIALTETGGTGVYYGTFPASIVAGTYRIDFLKKLGGSYSASDTALYSVSVKWSVAAADATTPAGNLYCSAIDVQKRLSAWGVELRVDDDSAAGADCIAEASSDVDLYLLPIYASDNLLTCRQVHFFARSLAAYYYCIRRNNDAPAPAQAEHDKTMDALRAIAAGTLQLSNVPKKGGVIQVSVQRYDNTLYPSLRTDRTKSTPTNRLAQRRLDYTAERLYVR